MKCPICERENCVQVMKLYDDRYGYPGSFPLFRCIDCGHGFLEVEFSQDELKILYSSYYPRSTFKLDDHKPYKEVKGFPAWFNGERCSAFRWVPKNVRVLDIGCGFGESLGYHRSRACDVYGVEADENIEKVAEKFGYKVHVGLFDPELYEEGFFDYVTMDQVIEHVVDPSETLKGVARVLKPGGVAILSTPNSNGWGSKIFGKRWMNWHVPYHLQQFSAGSMKLAAEKEGLALENVRTITNSAWLGFQWKHLFIFPVMGEPSAFWSPKRSLDFSGKLVKMIFAVIHRTKIDHIVTRTFDGLGIGDNYLFFLRKK